MSGRRMAWILAPLLTLALGLQIREAERRLRASRTLAVVQTITSKLNQRGRLTRQLLERNIQLLRAAERLDPALATLPIARGGQYLSLERPKAAILALEKALTLEQRGEIYALIGRAELDLGRRQEAEVAFRRAIVLDHNQRRRLKSYLLPDSAPPSPKRADLDAIFASSFEAGDLSDWSSVKDAEKEDPR